MTRLARIAVACVLVLFSRAAIAQPFPLSSGITYQGQLRTGGSPYNGSADFVFKLFNSSAGATQVGGTIGHNGVAIVDGTFTVSLDFGAISYNGEERWLQIEAHTPGNGGAGPYTVLTPRQRLAAAPYALRALNASISGTQPNALAFTNATNAFVGSSLSIDGSTLHVDSINNRVGIGAPAPQRMLQVGSGAIPGSEGMIRLESISNSGIAYRSWDVGVPMTGDSTSGIGYSFIIDDALLIADAPDFMVQWGTGNVGIGVESPGARLDVANNNSADAVNTAVFRAPFNGPNISHVHHGVLGDWYIRSAASGGRVILQDSGGNVGIGTTDPTHKLTVQSPNSDALRLIGPDTFGSGARFNFGDSDFVYIEEDIDDSITIAADRIALMDNGFSGGLVGIGTTAPGTKLHIANGNAAMNSLQSVNIAAAGTNVASGVVGITSQANVVAGGVRGHNAHTNGTGVIGAGNNVAPAGLVGGSGGAFTGNTTGVYANSITGGVGEALHTSQFSDIVRVGHWNGSSFFKIIGAGTVSTVVNDVNEQPITMFAPESPEVLFQDFGDGMLINGFAHIELDPNFARNVLIDVEHPMRVFIQLEGDENCQGVVVKNKTATGFDVVELRGGASNTPFQYQITCSRADQVLPSGRVSRFADLRFPPAPASAPTLTSEGDPMLAGQVQQEAKPKAEPMGEEG